ncbi:MAG: DUF2085 domain-containing protein [Chloroflexota bacterium]
MQGVVGRSIAKIQNPKSKIALVVLGVLVVLAFYTLSDPGRLADSHLLNAADYAGYAICHRIPSRSFTIAGRQMPLCARCTGMYLGIFLTFAVLGLAGRWRWSELPPLRILLILVGFVGVMGIDGINSYSHFFLELPHLYEPRNWLRLVTGMGTGLALGSIVFPALAQTLWREQVARPSLGNGREFGGLLLVGVAAILLVLSNQAAVLFVLAMVSAAGVVLIITALNTMVLLIAFRRDARSERWWQAAGPLLVGLVLAIAEIAAVDVARFALTGTMAGLPGL